ncbi:MAG: hypothetical protein ACTSQZ_01835, partial [Candidatus Thorarchaeota archaeon]
PKMVRRLFGRKKDEEKKTEDEVEPEVSSEASEVTVEEPKPVESSVEDAEPEVAAADAPKGTIPYHDSIQDRLNYLLTDPEMASSIEAPDEFILEFMAMGERFSVSKKAMGSISIVTGSAADEDAYIRIGNDVVQALLSASTFAEFSEIYLKYYKAPEPGMFVKIELRKQITDLNRRGYARIPALKLLIGAAR